jgi:hypothetical protein
VTWSPPPHLASTLRILKFLNCVMAIYQRGKIVGMARARLTVIIVFDYKLVE